MKQPDRFTLSTQEGEAILARLSIYAPSRSDCEILMQVVRWYFWLVYALQETKLTLKRLRSLLFGKSLKASLSSQEASAPSQAGGGEPPAGVVLGADPDDGAAPPQDSQKLKPAKPKGGHRPGTGRLGADGDVGAERVECRHEELASGQRCPACGQGRLYELPPGVEIRIDGNSLLSALRYDLQKLRCSACGQIFTAPLPSGVSPEKYSPRARAVLVVGRYYLGLPFYRMEGYQAMLGVPIADATQWDQIEKVANGCYLIFRLLERLAAQGDLIHQDDTSVRILTLLKENQRIRGQAAAQGLSRPKERTGMFTTALVVRVGERLICLYYSGRDHAGENLATLLEKREADQARPLVMSHALSRNEIADEGLVHGRRQFSDIEAVFPSQCRVVLDALKQIFDHDEEARDQQMSPQARLAYHQTYSQPLMDELRSWLDDQLADRLAEDNSSLGRAIVYMQNHWATLTRFLSVPGAPLENNIVERALKLFIRQRKNSLFYKSEHSAYIGSVLTSLIAKVGSTPNTTCIYAGVNVIDYLVALQEHRAEVFADPAAWLPWTYATSRASP